MDPGRDAFATLEISDVRPTMLFSSTPALLASLEEGSVCLQRDIRAPHSRCVRGLIPTVPTMT